MKELDVLLERWLRTRYAGATPFERAGFEALLELPDPQLRQYLLNGEVPLEGAVAQAVQGILASARIMSPAAVEPSGPKPL
jgi:succinate dehydrogenase flavin-adding protein (antitoxin of CptAB toxin-antitoxin module)